VLHHLHRRLLGDVWGCRRVAVDATGVGAGVASWLARSLGDELVEQVVFSAPEKSRLAYTLLGMVNTGRCRLYARDGSAEWAEFWREAVACRYELRGGEQMRFYVPEAEGHDDFVVSLALCARAAYGAVRPSLGALIRPRRTVV
jgi:phage FluMu gp28-like protein